MRYILVAVTATLLTSSFYLSPSSPPRDAAVTIVLHPDDEIQVFVGDTTRIPYDGDVVLGVPELPSR